MSLYQAVKFSVFGRLLAEHRVSVRGRVSRKVGWGILLCLSILLCQCNHISLRSVIELLGGIDNLVSHVLLGAFWLSSQERSDCSTSQGTTNLPRTSSAQLVNDSRVFLTKTTRMQKHWPVIPLQPSHPSKHFLCRREHRKCNEES